MSLIARVAWLCAGCVYLLGGDWGLTYQPAAAAGDSGQALNRDSSPRYVTEGHHPYVFVSPHRLTRRHVPVRRQLLQVARNGIGRPYGSVAAIDGSNQMRTRRFTVRGFWHLDWRVNCRAAVRRHLLSYFYVYVVTDAGEPPSLSDPTGKIVNVGGDYDNDDLKGRVLETSTGTYHLIINGCQGAWKVRIARG